MNRVITLTRVLTAVPMWCKDATGKITYLNDAYEQVCLSPRGYSRGDYLHKNDFAVWPADIAAQFRAHDREVVRKGIDIKVKERVEIEPGIIVEMTVIKMAHQGGTFGAAIPAGMEDHPSARKIMRALEYRRLARREEALTAIMRSDPALN